MGDKNTHKTSTANTPHHGADTVDHRAPKNMANKDAGMLQVNKHLGGAKAASHPKMVSTHHGITNARTADVYNTNVFGIPSDAETLEVSVVPANSKDNLMVGCTLCILDDSLPPAARGETDKGEGKLVSYHGHDALKPINMWNCVDLDVSVCAMHKDQNGDTILKENVEYTVSITMIRNPSKPKPPMWQDPDSYRYADVPDNVDTKPSWDDGDPANRQK